MAIVGVIGLVASLAAFVLSILCAIKMFQAQQIWQGILTILCWIFGVIYVMQKKNELGLEKLAMPYIGCVAVSILCNIAIRVMAPSAI